MLLSDDSSLLFHLFLSTSMSGLSASVPRRTPESVDFFRLSNIDCFVMRNVETQTSCSMIQPLSPLKKSFEQLVLGRRVRDCDSSIPSSLIPNLFLRSPYIILVLIRV